MVAVSSSNPSSFMVWVNVGFYILSGCSQPLLVTVARNAGLADPTCQLYMLFYYLGPASVLVWLLWMPTQSGDSSQHPEWPSRRTLVKGGAIALWDIGSQTLNYTGAVLAGPTLFAIIYSSVTIWTAVFSRLLLGRQMSMGQWVAVVCVFFGLSITGLDAKEHLGENVVNGVLMVTLGSAMHGVFYVLSEAIMTTKKGDASATRRQPSQPNPMDVISPNVNHHHTDATTTEELSVAQNCGVQGIVAFGVFFVWQMVYTRHHWQERIAQPVHDSNTSTIQAIGILLVMTVVNLVHAMTFFHTLRHFPGGATSAGIMKGLQAVLVFVVSHFLYCGNTGGMEMCFTLAKTISLITVVGGVTGYGVATQDTQKEQLRLRRADYDPVQDVEDMSLL